MVANSVKSTFKRTAHVSAYNAETVSSSTSTQSFTIKQFKTVVQGSENSRIEALGQLLGYQLWRRDPSGSRFWYLHPGKERAIASDTQPIAVGFYDELLRGRQDKL